MMIKEAPLEMITRLQRLTDDPDAREALTTQARRHGDMETLQDLANLDPALGRRIARRLISAGCDWSAYAALSPDERPIPVAFSACLSERILFVSLMPHLFFFAVAHWFDRERRLFACDCAERVLPIFERAHPGHSGPRRAIEHARVAATRGDPLGDEAELVMLGVMNARIYTQLDARIEYRTAGHTQTPVWAVRNAAEAALACIDTDSRKAADSAQHCAEHAMLPSRQHKAEVVWQRERLLQCLLDEVD